jgi:hypothetical protein
VPVSALWKGRFVVPFAGAKSVFFRHWNFVLSGFAFLAALAMLRAASDDWILRHSWLPPVDALGWPKGEPEEIRFPPIGVPSAAFFSDLQKT